MRIILEIADDLAAHLLPPDQDPARAALEVLTAEGYRTHRLSEHQVRILLGYQTRMEVHAFLAKHDVPLHYTLEHLQQDIRASDLLYALRTVQAVHAE